jgi:hypothetical protein
VISLSELEKQVSNFNICLQEERFFDAHEAIESIWFPLRKNKNDELKLLRGYINAAVSFELYKRGRYESAERVWCTFIKHQPLVHSIEYKYRAQYKAAEAKILEIRERFIL